MNVLEPSSKTLDPKLKPLKLYIYLNNKLILPVDVKDFLCVVRHFEVVLQLQGTDARHQSRAQLARLTRRLTAAFEAPMNLNSVGARGETAAL